MQGNGGDMINEVLFVTTLLMTFTGALLCFRLFGKKGIYAWIAFSTAIVNIEVLKCVDMFGLSVTLGNVLYGSTFLCTDILSENYGGKESRKAVLMGFVFQLIFIVLTQLSMRFVPNRSDFISEHLALVFGFMPRICLASLTAFLISNTLDTYLYDFLAKRTNRIWIRNNGSTMCSQAIDTLIFSILAFGGVYENRVVWEITLTTYLIKILVAAIDTPFAYIGKAIYKKQRI